MSARHWIIGAVALVVVGAGVVGVAYAVSTTTTKPLTQAKREISASTTVACTTEANTFRTAVDAYRATHFGSPMPTTTSAFVHALTTGRDPLLVAPPRYLDAAHSTVPVAGSPRPGAWTFNPGTLAVNVKAC